MRWLTGGDLLWASWRPDSRRAFCGGRIVVPALVVALGCANEQPPPGALPDARPPQVIRIVPGRDTVAMGFGGDAKIVFDEPIRAGDLGRQLTASPADRFDVSTGFSDIRIHPRNGWRDSAVYCFELPAGIVDLLNNRTTLPIEFCFSTGPPLTQTLVTGTVLDEETGRTAVGGRVVFRGLPADTTPYTAVADQKGAFSLRAVPPGRYDVVGFMDRNRNLRLDRLREPYDSASFELAGPSSTATLEFHLVEPDSTPPRLVNVAVVDSATIRLEFDDPLLRRQPEASVVVADTATGEELELSWVQVGEPEEVEKAGPEGQPEPGPGATRDTGVAGPDTVAQRPRTAAEGSRAGPRAQNLPARAVPVRFRSALRSGVFRVRAEGFVNLRKLVGGGEATFEYAPDAPSGGKDAGW